MSVMSLQNIFYNILSQPTAPSKESWIKSKCKTFCIQNNINFFDDSFGNLWLNASSVTDINSKKYIFVAHMDHPGIVIEKSMNNQAIGSWYGGSPQSVKSLPVTLFSDSKQKIKKEGRIIAETLKDNNVNKVLIQLSENVDVTGYGACISTLENGYEIRNHFIVGERLDDLISVCALLEILKNNGNFAVMLTREEEIGLLGAVFDASQQFISKDVIIVSIDVTEPIHSETPLGKGMIIRYGDNQTALGYPLIHNLEEIARSHKDIKWQVLGTSEGVAELTSFAKYGYRVGALGIPVLNMHNKSINGDFAREVACLHDLENLTKFLSYLIKV